MKKTILAANWKMYLNENESVDFIKKMNQEDSSFSSANVILFPSHTCINQVQKNLKSKNFGKQNMLKNLCGQNLLLISKTMLPQKISSRQSLKVLIVLNI